MDQGDLEDYEDSNQSLDNDIDAMEEEEEEDEDDDDDDEDEDDDDGESPDNEVAEDSHEEEEEEEEEEVDSTREGGGDGDSDSDSNSIATSDAISANDVDTSDLSEHEHDQRCIMVTRTGNKIEDFYQIVREAFRCEKVHVYEEMQQDLEEEKVLEFNQPLEELNEKKEERIHIGMELQKYRQHYAVVQHNANIEILDQNLNNEKSILKDSIKEEINESIRKLHEEFNRADKEDFLYESSFYKQRNNRKHSLTLYDETYGEGKRPRKPVTVSGPYIVYMLKEEEIMEDLNYISTFVRPNKPYHHRGYGGSRLNYAY